MKDIPKAHPLQRAWASGVFDARITMPRSGFVLRFESTDEPLMRRFLETVGIGHLEEHEKKQCTHPVWVYRTTNMDDTRTLLLFVSPFLSSIRLKQAAEMLARIERSPRWIKENPKKAASSVTAPVANVQVQTPPPNTQTDGYTASPVGPTTEQTQRMETPLD